MKLKIPTFLLILIFQFLNGQEKLPVAIKKYIEDYLENSIGETESITNLESHIEILEFYYNNPLNINSAQKEDFERLWFLNDFQILSLIDYRKNIGGLVSLHELNYIYGFSGETVNLLMPFIYTGTVTRTDSVSIKKIVRNLNYDWLLQSGYNTSSDQYENLPINIYSRFFVKNKDIFRLGIIAENDVGEPFFKGVNKRGFDFYSGHIQFNGKKWINTIIGGDFRYNAGQGLLIWNGFGSYKSSQIEALEKRGQGLSGNTSKNEFNFLRGGGFTLTNNMLKLSLYGSFKKLDGSVDTLASVYGISNISKTGYHRTLHEQTNKKSIDEQLFGATLGIKTLYSRLNLNFLKTVYSLPFLESEKVYKYKNFTGKKYLGVSADYKFMLKKAQFFGEVAHGNETLALISGINLMPSSNFYMTLLHRYYPESYFSPYANMLINNSSLQNEKGFFAGFKWRTNWKCIITLYTDIYTYPWFSFSTNGPSNRKDYLTMLECFPNDCFNFYIRYKIKSRENNRENKVHPVQINPTVKQNLRFNYDFKLSSRVSMTGRLEWCQSGNNQQTYSTGYLLYEGFRIYIGEKSTFTFRYTFFNINDYNSRIYVYEHDVLYGFSIPAYFGEGCKINVLMRQEFGQNFTVWIRYGFLYPFEENKKNKHYIKSQVRIRF